MTPEQEQFKSAIMRRNFPLIKASLAKNKTFLNVFSFESGTKSCAYKLANARVGICERANRKRPSEENKARVDLAKEIFEYIREATIKHMLELDKDSKPGQAMPDEVLELFLVIEKACGFDCKTPFADDSTPLEHITDKDTEVAHSLRLEVYGGEHDKYKAEMDVHIARRNERLRKEDEAEYAREVAKINQTYYREVGDILNRAQAELGGASSTQAVGATTTSESSSPSITPERAPQPARVVKPRPPSGNPPAKALRPKPAGNLPTQAAQVRRNRATAPSLAQLAVQHGLHRQARHESQSGERSQPLPLRTRADDNPKGCCAVM